MSGVVLDRPEAETGIDEPMTPAPQADESLLEDRVPPYLKLSRRTALCTVVFGLIYVFFCLKPLWHTDLWGHLSYGRQIIVSRSLPTTEPLLPLAKGMPVVDTAWLSQVLGYATVRTVGVTGLQGLSAMLITITTVLLFHRAFARTRSLLFGFAAVMAFLWLDASPLSVARPQLAGLLCFLIVLHRSTSRRPSPRDWWLIPLVHALWANLHGSFVMGLTWLGMMAAGRAFDLLRRTGTVRSLCHDDQFRRFALWTELSAVAALVNPYGLKLYLEVLTFGRNANLASLTEWQPIDVRAAHGMVFVLMLALMAIVYRISPRRIAAWEVIGLMGLSLASLWSARFLVWWAPVAALLLVMHAHASLRKWAPWRAKPVASPATGKWTVVTIGLVWVFFAISPLGHRILQKKDPPMARAVSKFTPLAAIDYLRKNPPGGQMFNTYEWGDFLQWAGPPGVQVFVNSHAHVLPREIWQHYLQVIDQSAGWDEVLDRYGVNTVLLDKPERDGVIRRLKDDAKWKVGYEDTQAAVFLRRKPF